MMNKPCFIYAPILFIAIFATASPFLFPRRSNAQQPAPAKSAEKAPASLGYPGEKHLAHIRQLTFGGESAEAYFSADDKFLIFQHQGQFFDPRTPPRIGPAPATRK